MENIDRIVNELMKKLLETGSANFSENGLTISTSYKDGKFSIDAKFESPEEDNTTKELVKEFEEYIKSLSDDFFIEVVESFPEGQLKDIQDKLDSECPCAVREAIDAFMKQLKKVTYSKIQKLDKDIENTEKELADLIEIRDSYIHVINKNF